MRSAPALVFIYIRPNAGSRTPKLRCQVILVAFTNRFDNGHHLQRKPIGQLNNQVFLLHSKSSIQNKKFIPRGKVLSVYWISFNLN